MIPERRQRIRALLVIYLLLLLLMAAAVCVRESWNGVETRIGSGCTDAEGVRRSPEGRYAG